MRDLKTRIRQAVSTAADYIEIIIAVFLSVVVIMLSVRLFSYLGTAISSGFSDTFLSDVLGMSFNLAICIEFIRMLTKHSMKTVIEVLVFAIARGMIISHESTADILLSVIAIAILFAVRKFLFQHGDEDE